MAKMVNKLTAKNGLSYGIEVAPQYDFEDDGNHFRGFIYKGIPMTQLYSRLDKTVYLAIRVDYLRDNNFTYSEWMDTEEYRLCDKFNGYSGEFSIEELVENLEKIIKKINEMNNTASVSEEDFDNAIATMINKANEIDNFVKFASTKIDWSADNIHTLVTHINYLAKEAKNIRYRIERISEFSLIDKKNLIERQKYYDKSIDEDPRAKNIRKILNF